MPNEEETTALEETLTPEELDSYMDKLAYGIERAAGTTIEEEEEETAVEDEAEEEEEEPKQPEPQKSRPKLRRKLPKVEVQPLQPREPQQEPEPAVLDEEFDDSLNDEMRHELELAKFGERKFPDQYKGKTKEIREYFKKIVNFFEDNPDSTETSEEFIEFQEKNRPNWTPAERRKLERLSIKDEVDSEYSRRFEEMESRMQNELFVRDTIPQVEKRLKDWEAGFITDEEKGLELTADDLETNPILKSQFATAKSVASTYLKVMNNLEAPSPENKTHIWLRDFLEKESQRFYQSAPQKELVRDGKQFIPYSEWAKAAHANPQEANAKYWTIDDDMVLSGIRNSAINGYKKRLEEWQQKGYEFKKVGGSKPNSNGKPPGGAQPKVSPPKAKPSAIPANSSQVSSKDPDIKKFLSRLGKG